MGCASYRPQGDDINRRLCSVDGCERPYLARDYCSMHWQRWKKTGAPGGPETLREKHPRCAVEGCTRSRYGHSYCNPHLRRLMRTGHLGAPAINSQDVTCSVDGCEDTHSAKGYCASHYARYKRKGSAGPAFTYRRRKPRDRDEHGNKQCRTCDRWLPESSYAGRSGSADRLTSWCLDCGYFRSIAKRYGVEPSWYAETLAAQGGGCAICGKAPEEENRLYIDHDHGHCPAQRGCPQCVRGILCGPCNTGIGMFREDTAKLHAAINYLERTADRGSRPL